MSRTLSTLAGAALGALVLGAVAVPAQAGDLAVSFGFGGPRPVYDHGYGHRPVARFYDDGFHARPYHRPLVERRIVEEDDLECRVVVKRRVNAFGDLVIKRIRICD